jgi:hypothetical protein
VTFPTAAPPGDMRRYWTVRHDSAVLRCGAWRGVSVAFHFVNEMWHKHTQSEQYFYRKIIGLFVKFQSLYLDFKQRKKSITNN